jgi:hypothetical protein
MFDKNRKAIPGTVTYLSIFLFVFACYLCKKLKTGDIDNSNNNNLFLFAIPPSKKLSSLKERVRTLVAYLVQSSRASKKKTRYYSFSIRLVNLLQKD